MPDGGAQFQQRKSFDQQKSTKSFMRFFLTICVFVLWLAGCASGPSGSQPSVMKGALPAGSKVGLLISVGSGVAHEHIGTTIFNNFTKNRTLSFDVGDRARDYLSTRLAEGGFVVVDIERAGFRMDQFAHGLPSQTEHLGRLRQELGLQALVVVREQRVMASLECSGGPCSERYMEKSGLFTRGVFNLTRYIAVAALDTKVLLLDSSTDLGFSDPLKSELAKRVKVLSFAKEPENLQVLTEEEFAPVAGWIDEYLKNMASAVTGSLQ